ncbi:MAG: hypothetical protein J3R72DRAFT_206806 [Linnemannia gamsii]|nr:MAG: hypothetical protein J3R72DRAFT_206806 [Linnemannia gamsii]
MVIQRKGWLDTSCLLLNLFLLSFADLYKQGICFPFFLFLFFSFSSSSSPKHHSFPFPPPSIPFFSYRFFDKKTHLSHTHSSLIP